MVETYQTEEEQVEALKKWWQENSRSTVLAIAVALGAGFGWQEWQGYRVDQAEAASTAYEEMLQAVSVGTADGASQEQQATARHLATVLKTDFSASTYAQFAALHLARLNVSADLLADAEEELRWVLAQSPAPEIQLVTQLRLARVVAARGDTATALKLVTVDDAGAFAASYAEAEGDFLLAADDPAAARIAYERAQILQAGAAAASGPLQLKLDSLTPVPARELETTSTEPPVETIATPALEGEQ